MRVKHERAWAAAATTPLSIALAKVDKVATELPIRNAHLGIGKIFQILLCVPLGNYGTNAYHIRIRFVLHSYTNAYHIRIEFVLHSYRIRTLPESTYHFVHNRDFGA
jgi:hypothetical protein